MGLLKKPSWRRRPACEPVVSAGEIRRQDACATEGKGFFNSPNVPPCQTDPLNRRTDWVYDPHGRKASRALPAVAGQSVAGGFHYDPAGNMDQHTKFDGRLVTRTYDALHRLVGRSYPDATGAGFSWGKASSMRSGKTISITSLCIGMKVPVQLAMEPLLFRLRSSPRTLGAASFRRNTARKELVMTKSCLILLGIAVVFIVLVLVFFGPIFESARRDFVNRRMQSLANRVKSTPPDKAALSSMIRSLHSWDGWTRLAAIAYLGVAGPHAEPAVDEIVKFLDGPDAFARRQATITLGQIGPSASRAVPALMRASQQRPGDDVSVFGLESLGMIADPEDQSVIDLLKKASGSPDMDIREFAKRGSQSLESRRSGGNPHP